eukprot:g9457.t1
MVQQMEQTPFVYGGIGVLVSHEERRDVVSTTSAGRKSFVPVRAQLAALLAELAPGDLNGFLFPSSGSEANDCAIRLARLYTGKTKIFNQYRSYHGGTLAPLSATGDFRRRFAQDSATGFVKMFNPEPHYFRWGDTEARRTQIRLGDEIGTDLTDLIWWMCKTKDERACEMALACLEEQIVAEGPSTIAAIMVESIPGRSMHHLREGTGGVLIPAVGFMEGIRSLCNQYEILMICDEVMTGFGRTGELFGFQHFDGVIPDIVTSAKGLTGSWQPLSMVGVRQKLKDFFFDKATGWGSTFQAHPCIAIGPFIHRPFTAFRKYMLDQKLLTHVQTVIQPIMIEELDRLVSKYDFVKQELLLSMSSRIGFLRPPQVHCAPPLIISEGELRDGFQRLDRALNATAFEKGSQWQKAVSLLHAAGRLACRSSGDRLVTGLSEGELLRSFQQRSVEFDVVFCASVLSACEKGPRWEIGIELLDWMRSSLDLPLNLFCFGAAISACRKGSNWQGAWALLEDIWSSALQPDLVAFNATISSCEKAQRWEFAIELLEMMSLQQVPPDVVSFNATASACEKRAQWSWALWVFSQLKRTWGPAERCLAEYQQCLCQRVCKGTALARSFTPGAADRSTR